MKNKLVTIITVCYNSEKTIERTIKSVLNQTFNNYEYIFIDGMSTDNTNSIIDKYKKQFEEKGVPVTHIIEKDEGIYDAMNKGAELANGVWVNYMNSDDYFYTNKILEEIFTNNSYEDVDVIYGDTRYIKEDEEYIEKGKSIDTITYHIPFCHQSAFVKSYLQKKYRFNKKYKISADYDFFLNLYLKRKKFIYLPITISNFSFGGISNSNLIDTYKEDSEVKHNYKIINKNSFISRLKYIYFILKCNINRLTVGK